MLSDSKIIEAMRSGDLMLLDPATGDSVDLRPEQLQPVSVDLRLGAVADYTRKHCRAGGPWEWSLAPGAFTLASTFEVVALSEQLAGKVEGKSTIARLGLQVEAAGLVDPGFSGQLTLELINFSDETVTLVEGQRICQLCLFEVDGKVMHPYGSTRMGGTAGSHYQGQRGPTPARGVEDLCSRS